MYKKTAYAPRKCYLDYTDERLWERGYLKVKKSPNLQDT